MSNTYIPDSSSADTFIPSDSASSSNYDYEDTFIPEDSSSSNPETQIPDTYIPDDSSSSDSETYIPDDPSSSSGDCSHLWEFVMSFRAQKEQLEKEIRDLEQAIAYLKRVYTSRLEIWNRKMVQQSKLSMSDPEWKLLENELNQLSAEIAHANSEIEESEKKLAVLQKSLEQVSKHLQQAEAAYKACVEKIRVQR
ncbi:MAG: hypothetical protein LBV12_07515 [Puniceicoccales bacterium]|jgi:predicted RNase H-like nuclease (RuvC/YqgF family)|nr:hypothetical protein [Puniceicoccales bacterium]